MSEPGLGRGIGAALTRPDGPAKVGGTFAYSSDLRAEGMLFGATLRSPHPAARITRIDTTAAKACDGVQAVLTHADVPGAKLVGSVIYDQPVLAVDEVRHVGEPVALVAATDPETARRAAEAIEVTYELVTPITSVEAAIADGARALHPNGDNIVRRLHIQHGDLTAPAPVTVEGTYALGMQDQGFLGPESGLAIPDGAGGVDLHVATQWLHTDRDQVADGLGLEPERVRVHLAGVGGAFGAREDLSMQLHACLLALATDTPVQMAYTRAESFLGHVHRHPAWLRYEHGATEDGRLVFVRATLRFDGGAYASSSPAVLTNAATIAVGPYAVPNAEIDAIAAYTNNPPCGAMRGFGAPQVAFAHEAQMDRLAQALGMDPVELRIRNALKTGDRMPTGQALRGPAPIPELLRALGDAPLPPELPRAERDPRSWPGSSFAATRGESVVRAVAYAAGYKNLAFSEGFDDFSTARVRVERDASSGAPRAVVHTAATEVGQGVESVQLQVAREELGLDDVTLLEADTSVGSAGSASASRLTWMMSGAVRDACREVRAQLDAGALDKGPVEVTSVHRHRPTHPLDERGQGEPHVAFAFVAHRAVVEVDTELGLARVVELMCAQDVGRAVNPLALAGQLHGGSLQGLGLALMEEIEVADGVPRSRSFSTYHLPTIVDAPSAPTIVLESGDPDSPYGVKGVGEMPCISSTPAIVAALRIATGHALERVPVMPRDLAGF